MAVKHETPASQLRDAYRSGYLASYLPAVLNALRQQRRARGFNQGQVGDWFDVAQGSVSRWESGEAPIDLEDFLFIINVLEMPLQALPLPQPQRQLLDGAVAALMHVRHRDDPSYDGQPVLHGDIYCFWATLARFREFNAARESSRNGGSESALIELVSQIVDTTVERLTEEGDRQEAARVKNTYLINASSADLLSKLVADWCIPWRECKRAIPFLSSLPTCDDGTAE